MCIRDRFYKAKEHKALGRRISTYEYRKAVDYAVELGLTEGFMQEKSSAKEEYLSLIHIYRSKVALRQPQDLPRCVFLGGIGQSVTALCAAHAAHKARFYKL